MRKTFIALALAAFLAACGGAGAGGSTPPGAKTTAPVVAGTEAPKEYNPGKPANPSSSPEEYFGY